MPNEHQEIKELEEVAYIKPGVLELKGGGVSFLPAGFTAKWWMYGDDDDDVHSISCLASCKVRPFFFHSFLDHSQSQYSMYWLPIIPTHPGKKWTAKSEDLKIGIVRKVEKCKDNSTLI